MFVFNNDRLKYLLEKLKLQFDKKADKIQRKVQNEQQKHHCAGA